jgi:hypothetical protein
MKTIIAPNTRRMCLFGALVAAFLSTGTLAANVARAQAHPSTGTEVREEIRESHASHWRHPRLRLGISGVGGGFFGATHGGEGGLAVRAGVQVDDVVGLYVQGQGLLGQYVPDPRPTSLVGFAFHEAMIDFTLLDTLQLGAGPSVDVIWGCDAGNSGTYCGRSGVFFGSDFRVAILTHHGNADHRGGIVFSLDAHPTWAGDELLGTLLLGIGGEMY